MKIIMSHSQTPEGALGGVWEWMSQAGCLVWVALFLLRSTFEWWGEKYTAGNQKEMPVSILLLYYRGLSKDLEQS